MGSRLWISIGASIFACALAACSAETGESDDIADPNSKFRACKTDLIDGLEDWLLAPLYPSENIDGHSFASPLRRDVLSMPVGMSDHSELSWDPVPSQQETHERLWAKAGLELPDSDVQVRILEQSHHWSSTTVSQVAVRDAEGIWNVSEVTVLNYGSDEYEEIQPALSFRLDKRDGEALDILIADPCIDAEPSSSDQSFIMSSGDTVWTIEIVGVRSVQPMTRVFKGFGRTALIYSILNPGRY